MKDCLMKGRKTVYVADDDEDDRMFIREALKSIIKDVRIVEIQNGEDLIAIIDAQGEDPSLILMDMNMPRMDGLEALSTLKSNPRSMHIPVIMLSTTTDQGLILKAYDQGINGFITKPASLPEYERMAEAINICFLHNYYPAPSRPLNLKKLKDKSILIIEDNDDHWHLMDRGLNQSLPDVKIIRTSDQESTLDFLNREWNTFSQKPELIILDLYLPTKKEGLDLLGLIRDFFLKHELPPVPVIVFSASSDQQDIKESYAQGANAFIVKSKDLNKSVSYFKDLCHFWWNTITLPKKHS